MSGPIRRADICFPASRAISKTATDPTCSFFSGCANFDNFAPGTRVVVRHYTYNGFAFLVNWSNDIDFQNVQLRTGPGIGFSVSNEGGYRGFRLYNSADHPRPWPPYLDSLRRDRPEHAGGHDRGGQ
jgi:hypothetical protein